MNKEQKALSNLYKAARLAQLTAIEHEQLKADLQTLHEFIISQQNKETKTEQQK